MLISKIKGKSQYESRSVPLSDPSTLEAFRMKFRGRGQNVQSVELTRSAWALQYSPHMYLAMLNPNLQDVSIS